MQPVISQVVAIRLPHRQRRATPGEILGDWEGVPLIQVTPEASGIPPAEWHHFEQAGWMLAQPRVQPPVASTRSLESVTLQSTEVPLTIGKITYNADNQLALDTGRAIVKFLPELSSSEVQSVIQDTGAAVVRPLKFVPNMFEVAAPKELSGVEYVASLSEFPQVLSAEPQLITYLGAR